MFFILSKIFWLFVQPVSLTFVLFLAGWMLSLLRRRLAGLVFVGLGLMIFGLSAFTTLGFNLIAPLEERFPRGEPLPSDVQTIIMLGGATAGRVSTARRIAELNEAGDRLTETLQLAKQYPQAKILLSGGVGLLIADGEPEAETARRFFSAQGIAPERLVLEGESRNTDENAANSAALLGAEARTIVLVTSAFHMPRSVGLFRSAGLEVLPRPVDYRSSGTEGMGFDLANPILNLNTTTLALREWIGLIAYKLTGRIGDWFPAP
ncbi:MULTISPECIES: YdcF family protein [unclassified Devosia]|uniref:YdcF family protein n=1 Tax=unclassified Devosia TaxID=196773 RepID=UPI00155574AE|nr:MULTISPECIES: YdcF family protein [unclassified Devosia]